MQFLVLITTAAAAAAAVAAQPTIYDASFGHGLADNITGGSDTAVDVQYASCKIITDRIVATAEGKFSRFCHGICNISTNVG